MFDFLIPETTNSKVLKILLQHPHAKVHELIQAIQEQFPKMSQQEIESAIFALEREDLLKTLCGDNQICAVIVSPSADARLREKYELRKHDRIWDVVKFIAGVISGLIVAYVKMSR